MGKGRSCLDRNVRQNLTYCVKHNGPFRWSNILGFSKEELINHLKENFEEGMSFENYGEWVLSFYIPRRCYKFKSIRDEDFKRCWSLKNIKPRWLKDAQHQKAKISKKYIDENSLWDIIPTGNIGNILVD